MVSFITVVAALSVSRDQVVAFRLAAHHLIDRLPPDRLVEAAAPVGVQDSRVESAALALAAQVEGVDAGTVATARSETRTLLTFVSDARRPYLLPVADAAAFTAGAVPTDRESFATFLGGWAEPIADAELSPFDLLDQMAKVATTVLDGRILPVDDLRHAIYDRVPALHRVRRPASMRADMPESLFRALGLTGTVCITAGEGITAMNGRTDQWLGSALPSMAPDTARAELVRRFLHAYGPSTPAAFAVWTNRSPADAREAFAPVAGELAEVDAGGTSAWLLATDEPTLRSPPLPAALRLLPPLDPFLNQRDRATLVPDAAHRQQVWRPVGPPGVVMAGRRVAATWRGQKRGRTLEITVDGLGALSGQVRANVVKEADRMAPARGCTGAAVSFALGWWAGPPDCGG
ncbi:MAG: DNA glycosylase AlkZ-like family protein [Acidimicrobiales bacterium]